jgi:putative hydrolase of the HAD superfamily
VSVKHRPRAILFDIDNTLINRDAALRRFLVQILPQKDAEVILQRDQSGNAVQGTHEWIAQAYPVLGDTADTVAANIRKGIIEALHPDPDVLALLECLGRHYALGLVSNGGGSTQRQKLDRAHLEGYLRVIVIEGEAGIAKPEPGIFELALKALDVFPRDVLFVGDSPTQDIASAGALGLQTCWVSHGATYPDRVSRPDTSVSSVLDLCDIVEC